MTRNFWNPKLRRARQNRGITLLEMALIVPFLLVFTMGLVQYGIVANTSSVLTNLSRDGARYAAIHAEEGALVSDAATRTFIRERAKGTAVLPESLTDEMIVVIAPSREAGKQIRVDISYPMSRKLFLPSRFFGIRIFNETYTASSTMLIEGIS